MIRKVKANSVINGQMWNEMVDLVNRLSNVRTGNGLDMIQHPGGLMLGVSKRVQRNVTNTWNGASINDMFFARVRDDLGGVYAFQEVIKGELGGANACWKLAYDVEGNLISRTGYAYNLANTGDSRYRSIPDDTIVVMYEVNLLDANDPSLGPWNTEYWFQFHESSVYDSTVGLPFTLPFWARLTNHAEIADGSTKRHTYSWSEVTKAREGYSAEGTLAWEDLEDGRTGTTAYNLMETPASGDTYSPIPNNTVVKMWEVHYGAYPTGGSETQEFWFDGGGSGSGGSVTDVIYNESTRRLYYVDSSGDEHTIAIAEVC